MIELPPFRMWLTKTPTVDGWVSSWNVDRSELLAGERSIFYWLHAIQKRSREDATRLTRLYYAVRDDGAAHPTRDFDMTAVSAGMRRDVQPHEWLFHALTDATWCEACWSCPRFSTCALCAWCFAAPIAELAA
jgi:hypothetical protein